MSSQDNIFVFHRSVQLNQCPYYPFCAAKSGPPPMFIDTFTSYLVTKSNHNKCEGTKDIFCLCG